MPYSPAIDGIRALACLVVVLLHARVPGFSGGQLGVDVFFVLSGFLITRGLVEKRPALMQFYLRRARRLYPALLTMLAVLLVGWLVVGGPEGLPQDALMVGAYLSDYGLPWMKNDGLLMHTWSLSVEEHFYLLWPVILYALLQRYPPERVARITVLTCGALLLWRLAMAPLRGPLFLYQFDTRATGLAAGCALGLARITLPCWAGWGGMGVVALGMALFPALDRSPWAMSFAEAGTVLMIAGNWRAPFAEAALAYIGRLSYGWYLWHFPLGWLAWEAIPDIGWGGAAAVSVVGGLAMAALSYHTIEALFRRPRSSAEPIHLDVATDR